MIKNPLLDKIKQICKDEEYILIFDSGEGFDWGVPTVFPDGILLSTDDGQTIEGYKSYFYKWEDISIIAHHGFSARHIQEKEFNSYSREKICQIRMGYGKGNDDLKDGDSFSCSIGIHDNEFDEEASFKIPKQRYANEPQVCIDCGEKSTHYRYFGDPIEIYGQFSLLGSGIYIQQNYGAEGVIMPLTDIIQVN